jgi:transposase
MNVFGTEIIDQEHTDSLISGVLTGWTRSRLTRRSSEEKELRYCKGDNCALLPLAHVAAIASDTRRAWLHLRITIVTNYVREKKRRMREVFVPLCHSPGHVQVDFGESLGVIGRVEGKLHCLAVALPHSDAFFIKAYPAETSEAFCDGHNSAFSFFWRRAAVDPLRQYHDRGGEDLSRRQTDTDQNFCRIPVSFPVQ